MVIKHHCTFLTGYLALKHSKPEVNMALIDISLQRIVEVTKLKLEVWFIEHAAG